MANKHKTNAIVRRENVQMLEPIEAKLNKARNRRTSLSASSAFQKASLDPALFLDLQVDLLDRQNAKKKKLRLDPRAISGGLDT